MLADKLNNLAGKKWTLALVLLVIFFSSIAYSFYYRIEPAVDARAYDNIGLNILAGNGFKEQGTDIPILFDRAIQRAGPAYEYLLAGVYAVFGRHYAAVWIFQALLHTLTAWLIFKICQKIFSESGSGIGLIAMLIFGLHPDLIEISAMLMTETLYLFTIALVVYIFLKVFEKSQSLPLSALLGVALVLSIYSRPTVVLFVPVILVLYFIRKNYLATVVCLLTMIILATPWTYRNWKIYNQFIPTTLIGQYNIWLGNTVSSDGGQLAGGYNPWDEFVAERGFSEVKKKVNREFRNFIFQHPVNFIKLTSIRFVRSFSLIRPMGFWFYQTGLAQMIFVSFSGIFIALLFTSGLAGVFLAMRQKKPLYYYLAAFAITAPLPLLITVVQSRYRFQLYPFLAIFGGYAIIYWLNHKNWWKEKFFLFPTFCLLLITVIDMLMNTERIIARIKLFF